MKQWSIKRKLVILCASLLGMVLTVGGVEHYGSLILVGHIEGLSKTQIPAIRNMTLADMMHDGISSEVYRALYVAELDDREMKQDVAKGLKELSENLSQYIAAIDDLDTQPKTKEAIGGAKGEINEYIKKSEEIVGLALSGRRDLAIAKLREFQAAFDRLEEKLGALGELIETDATARSLAAEKSAHDLGILNAVLISLGMIFGIFISFLIIKDLMTTLSSVIERLADSSQKVSGASAQSASSATVLSEASTEQAASLQETMASIEEISAMVSQNADSAIKVKSAVDTNQEVADEGSRSVGSMLHAIDEIRETNDKILSQMESSNKEFGEIVKIISEIGEKTKVINDIVFQTKLLSFNASVEAARAGEHGKGFAVVAEEVGNLAQMSGNAAKQITDMLSGSIKKVNEIVDETTRRVDQLVEVGKDKISMGQSTADKCRLALEKIAVNARTVASMVTEITHASKEQAQGILEINKAIAQLDQVTQQNSSVAQSSSSQAEQLNLEARVLTESIGALVSFVNGGPAGLTPTRTNLTPSSSGATVTALRPERQKRSSNAQQSPSAFATQRAAGSDTVPAGNDPNFEEF